MGTMVLSLIIILSATPATKPPAQKTGATTPKVEKPASTPKTRAIKTSRPFPKPGPLPFVAALLPGLLYPAGHLVMGDYSGHGRIMAMKGT
ncbi:hypothetical protein KKF84_13875, partial [Myxococcota bacterium]|nr:hypothetical protein [Myxococcota bacterium]